MSNVINPTIRVTSAENVTENDISFDDRSLMNKERR